jgi:N-acetylglucosamine-6-sulfatase
MTQLFRSILALAMAGLSVAASKPNIIMIMTDDQDLHLGSTDYQPILQKEFMAKGVSFTNHYCTTAQCCPSRASLLRGQAAHNTNITYVKFVSIHAVVFLLGILQLTCILLVLREATLTSG